MRGKGESHGIKMEIGFQEDKSNKVTQYNTVWVSLFNQNFAEKTDDDANISAIKIITGRRHLLWTIDHNSVQELTLTMILRVE